MTTTYKRGQRILAYVTWDGIRKLRNCRVHAVTGAGAYAVQVWSNQTNTYYADLIDIEASDIPPIWPTITW